MFCRFHIINNNSKIIASALCRFNMRKFFPSESTQFNYKYYLNLNQAWHYCGRLFWSFMWVLQRLFWSIVFKNLSSTLQVSSDRFHKFVKGLYFIFRHFISLNRSFNHIYSHLSIFKQKKPSRKSSFDAVPIYITHNVPNTKVSYENNPLEEGIMTTYNHRLKFTLWHFSFCTVWWIQKN